MKFRKTLIAALPLGAIALGVHAQSSVTLYGVVDTGIGYLSNQAPSTGATSGGAPVTKLLEGVWGGERFGFKGSEDLGGGVKTIFQLEEGYNADTGAMSKSGLMFSRASWVGLSSGEGTFTVGRQYTPYYTLLAPYSPTNWLTGAFGAHPGDIDNLDTDYRVNNALVYTSPNLSGFKFSGMYALGGTAGSFNAGSSWSVAGQYIAGPAGVGVGIERFNNATIGGGAWSSSSTAYSGTGEQGSSTLTNAYQNAAAQQRIAVTGGYKFSPQWDVSASYSNVQYIAGVNSGFSTAIFNSGGVVVHYNPVAAWDLAAGYAYTRSTEANGIKNAATYQQFNLTELYNLSKRTKLYVLEAYQHASGQTLNGGKIINATANIGEQSAAATAGQFGVTIGINHAF